MQRQLVDKRIHLHVIDAYQVAQDAGMGRRINTVMQTCFFAISGILPQHEAIAAIKHAVEKTYGRKGRRIAELNYRAIDKTLACLHEVSLPQSHDGAAPEAQARSAQQASEFVRRLTLPLIAGKGDALPVSLFPADGTWPTGTAKYEKRNLALQIPVIEAAVHPVRQVRVRVPARGNSRQGLPGRTGQRGARELQADGDSQQGLPAGWKMTYQVAPEDCTGCTLCVDICPIRDKSNVSRKAINMAEQAPLRASEAENWDFFLTLPDYDRKLAKRATVPGSMLLAPLFEFSGACVGCGETPYIRLATQLFGDRMMVANATGCSSIYGGNLPTTPYTTNAEGGGRRGATRCSRTTPSSASACALRPTNWPAPRG